MKKNCYITIKGVHINPIAQDVINERFEEKKEELSEIARSEFDECSDESAVLKMQEILEEFTADNIFCPETEFTTYGILENCSGDYVISFNDGISSLDNGEITTFVVHTARDLSMIKRGKKMQCLTFSDRKRCICDYNPTLGAPITLFSRSVLCELDDSGGSINLDYFIEVHGNVCEHNKFNITIRT